jgi:two-component system, cell cycle response regulator
MSLTNSQHRRVLIIDDDPASLDIIAEALKWEGYEVEKALSGLRGIELLNSFGPDLVILDMNMPEVNGIETLASLRKRSKYVSVLFISADSSTEAKVSGLDAGADDYIPKPFDPLELLARVRTQLRIKDLNDQLREVNEKLKELVDIDDLTGLYNMRSLYNRLEKELDRAYRYQRQVAVVMMDMDFFKSVNDGHDHLFGSFVLSEVGKIIRSSIRTNDLGARYGGDEFLIVLAEINRDGAMRFCDRLRSQIEKHEFVSGKDRIKLTASIGFSLSPLGNSRPDAKDLARAADVALYEAKRSGRNCVKFYSQEIQIAPADANSRIFPLADKKKVG